MYKHIQMFNNLLMPWLVDLHQTILCMAEDTHFTIEEMLCEKRSRNKNIVVERKNYKSKSYGGSPSIHGFHTLTDKLHTYYLHNNNNNTCYDIY